MSDNIATIVAYLKENAFLAEYVNLDNNESLTDAGVIDSISLLQMIDFLETEFSIKIPIEEIIPENFDSLARIDKFLTRMSKRKEM